MAKLRRILLKGIDSDEKLDIVSRCARMLVELGKRDPKVRDLAVHVIRQCKSKDQLCEAKALHAHVRDKVRYVKDIASVERLATPQRTLFMEKAGDCDDSSIALSALLESIGHETRLILTDPDLSGRFTHVIAQVKIGDKWYWMETTKKVPFGWATGYSISHIIDKKSTGEKDMKALDNLFSLSDIGRRGGGSRGGGSRGGGSRNSSSRSSARPASRSSKPAVKRTTGAARSRLTGIAQRAKSIRKNIARKAVQAKRAVSERIKRRAGSLRSGLVKRRDTILNRFKKGMIGKGQARTQIQSLKAKAAAAAKKLRDEKVKAIAPIIAFEAKKEEEVAEKQAELEKDVFESMPPEEVVQPEQGEEEPAQEEAQEESIEPERDEEAGEEETEGEEGFEPQETEDEADSESSSEEGLEEGIEDIGRIKKSRKKRGILLRARARPKGTLADKVTKTAAVLGGLGIAAWVIKGIIEARIKKGGE